jgi:23S rRNA-/tRNA-specific pseudouridylate synthase
MLDSEDTPIDQLPLNTGVHLLAHNGDGLVALEKPFGALSHPNESGDNRRSLLVADYDFDEECYYWTDGAGVSRRAWLINRLDSPTSGVILLGLNLGISQAIKKEFATHRVAKIYYALVRGTPKTPAGAWVDNLKKDVRRGNRLVRQGQVVSAKARYQTVKSPIGGFPITLIKLLPVTGRTHQLRVQCKTHGLPIVGDRTYGSFSFNKEVAMRTEKKRMMLHSGETVVNYNFKGKVRKFTATSELPEDFQSVLDYRPGFNQKHSKQTRSPLLAGRRFKS